MPTEMMMNDATTTRVAKDDWKGSPAYRFHILLTQDEADSFSAVVLNLPGAGSCGSTEEEAMANVKEAIRGVLGAYKASGQDIPWRDSTADNIPPHAKQK